MPNPTLATQVVHTFEQHIDGSPAEVFPLLCPEREKEWLPGWQARMLHSCSGLAEDGAVFASPHPGGEVLWYIVAYQPPRLLRFVRFEPDGVLVDIAIEVVDGQDGTSRVPIRYAFTATSAEGKRSVRARTPAAWQEMMLEWQGRMNAFLRVTRTR